MHNIKDMHKALLNRDNLIVLALLVAIVLIAIYLRTTMLQYYGFYEPDGFYYYSMVRATVDNNFHVPAALSISGWPSAAPYTEAKGLLWVTLLPYALLKNFGVSYYYIMRHIAVAFGLLDMLGAYLLSRYLSKDKMFGLLVIAFVGFSMGNAARTSALIYRGDTFTTFFLIMSLVFLVETMLQESRNRKLLFAVLAGIALSGSNLVWNGGSFADAIFIFVVISILTLAFIFRKEALASNSMYLLVSIITFYLITNIAQGVGFISGQQLVSLYYLPVYVAVFAVCGIAYYLTVNMHQFPILRQTSNRLLLIVAALVIGAVLFYAIDPSLVYGIFVDNGFACTTTGTYCSTIQELQPPSFQFLMTSFGANLVTTPPTLLMALTTIFGFNLLWVSLAGGIGTLLLLILLLPYLLMQVYDSGGLLSGTARARFDINIAMVAILVFFLLTAYLQMHAIRYNSLVSVPLAMLSAYTLYWLFIVAKGAHDKKPSDTRTSSYAYVLAVIGAVSGFVIALASGSATYAVLGLIFGGILLWYMYSLYKKGKSETIILLALFLLLVVSTSEVYYFTQNTSGTFGIISYAVFAANAIGMLAGIYYFYVSYGRRIEQKEYHKAVYALTTALLSGFFLVLLLNDYVYAATLYQADNINPQFISAMQWLKANSPNNSVVLTLWPDGSVVEGIANRTSVTDSVGSQNGSKMDPFATWILAGSPDPQFLESPINGKPDYLVVRFPWLIETQGIYTESFTTENVSLFGYLPILRFEETVPNATTSQLIFRNNATGYPYVVVNLMHEASNATRSTISGYIQQGPTVQAAFQYIGFYDQDTANFTLAQQPANQSNGELMLITYSSIPKQGFILNITGAYIFAPGIAQSNMIKFLYFCNSYTCTWDTSNASAQMVYGNSDTKIFKITYYNSPQNYT